MECQLLKLARWVGATGNDYDDGGGGGPEDD